MNADRLVEVIKARKDPPRYPEDPKGVRNRNPGNIETGQGFRGEVGSDGRFAKFDTDFNGIRAIGVDLLTKYYRGLVTVRSIISTWAPPGENNTEAYIHAVCMELGVLASTWLHLPESDVLAKLVTAIIRHENGGTQWYDKDQIAAACADAQYSKRIRGGKDD